MRSFGFMIYLDHSATTPLDDEVLEAMLPYFKSKFGNPSSSYKLGKEAKTAINNSRDIIAKVINAKPSEIIFTSGGTESDNYAIKGIAYNSSRKGNHIITTKVEHNAILNGCKALEKQGYEISYLDVDEFGMVHPEVVREAIKSNTILVSVIHANNEVGTINPIREIGLLTKEKGIYFHVDAVQSFGKLILDVEDSNIDLLSISSHKIYGPKGTGALYIRKGTKIQPLLDGGTHENSFRAGTENVPGIIGLGKATDIAYKNIEVDMSKISAIRDYFWNAIKAKFNNVVLNGHPESRLFNNLNISFLGFDSDFLLLQLDQKNIAASSGSACSAGSLEYSHVLRAMRLEDKRIKSAIRFSLGKSNTKKEIDVVIKTLDLIMKQ